MMKKIVIYGGAFSPPHLGHASAIDLVLRSFPCDEIWVMPSADRRDKKITADGDKRIDMLKIMIADLFAHSAVPVKVSSLEIDRPKLSTTYETLMELKEKFPEDEFYFLIGADVLGDIESKWFNGKELYRMANFLVIDCRNVNIPKNLPGNFIYLPGNVRQLGISSTLIRESLAKGGDASRYLTPGVEKYLRENKLYPRPNN